MFCPADNSVRGCDFHPPFNSFTLYKLGIAMTIATRTVDSAAVEVFNPVSVKPGIEEPFTEVHVSENSVPRLQSICRYRRSHFDLGRLKGDVNTGQGRDHFAFSQHSNWRSFLLPR